MTNFEEEKEEDSLDIFGLDKLTEALKSGSVHGYIQDELIFTEKQIDTFNNFDPKTGTPIYEPSSVADHPYPHIP